MIQFLNSSKDCDSEIIIDVPPQITSEENPSTKDASSPRDPDPTFDPQQSSQQDGATANQIGQYRTVLDNLHKQYCIKLLVNQRMQQHLLLSIQQQQQDW